MLGSPVVFDPYEALADRRRRHILNLLAERSPCSVNDLVEELALPQPAVSKHLAVLRKAGLVTMEKDKQFRRYSLNPEPLKTMHDWLSTFDRFWTDHLADIKKAAERKAAPNSATDRN